MMEYAHWAVHVLSLLTIVFLVMGLNDAAKDRDRYRQANARMVKDELKRHKNITSVSGHVE